MKNRYEYYYEVLENFQGSKDNFWRCEKYLATDFERNGFTVEELISNGKIAVGIKRSGTVNMDESLNKLINELKTKLASTKGDDVELNWYEMLYLLDHVSRIESFGEPVYYIALDTFLGSHDMFWRSEIYTIVEIECNGFTVDGLIKEGKIRLWQDGEEE